MCRSPNVTLPLALSAARAKNIRFLTMYIAAGLRGRFDVVFLMRLGCVMVDSRAAEESSTVPPVVLVRSSVNGVPIYAVSNRIRGRNEPSVRHVSLTTYLVVIPLVSINTDK